MLLYDKTQQRESLDYLELCQRTIPCKMFLTRYPYLILQLCQESDQDRYAEDYLCHVSLIDEISDQDRNVVKKSEFNNNPNLNIDPNIPYANLIGQRVTAGVSMNDPVDGQEKIFFLFPDLAVRTIGDYRFQCRLVDLKRYLWTQN